MSSYYVFGCTMDENNYADNIYEELLKVMREKKSSYVEDFEQYLQENPDEFETELECFKSFCDEYTNDTYMWDYIAGLLVDAINDVEFQNETVFRTEYNCIFVEPNIPADEEAKKAYPTQEQIVKILAQYAGRLLKEPVTVGWMEMYD